MASNRNYFITAGNVKCIPQDKPNHNKQYLKARNDQNLWDEKGLNYYELQNEKCFEYSNRVKAEIFHHNNSRPQIAKPIENYLESSVCFDQNGLIVRRLTSGYKGKKIFFFERTSPVEKMTTYIELNIPQISDLYHSLIELPPVSVQKQQQHCRH